MNIYLENAFKEYKGNRVLDINKLKFEEGCVYAVLGLNGSGKTTLLECIAGVNSLSGGIILYGDGKGIDKVRHDITIMTQRPYMFNDTVKNNIASGLRFRKEKDEKIYAQIDKYLGYFDIKDLLYKNAKSLSGGESAKTALLRAAVLETSVTLLDEPTASMDIESTISAEHLIKDMAKDKHTVLLVTHDLYQAQRVADYIIFMDKGKIIETGKKYKVLNNPEHKLVKLILNR